ncbi:MAG: DNA-binding domain-containing protein [Marinovum sp.]|nr:DNA-binding domain-containing protein [Marinovum sp.]
MSDISAEAPFRDALLDPSQAIPEGLLDGAGTPAGRRYDVYRNNIAVSLTEALETGFPAVAKLLGEQNFKGVAGFYLRHHPPKSARMMFYGQAFGEFLESFEPLAKFPYLGDVARLEFALRESYHAADHIALDPQTFAVEPEALMALTFRLAPSMRLISSPWPVYSLWAFNMAGGPKPIAGAQDVVILRTEFDPEPHLLGSGGRAFIEALAMQTTLGDAYEEALAIAPDFDLSSVLSLLIAQGALQGTTQ